MTAPLATGIRVSLVFSKCSDFLAEAKPLRVRVSDELGKGPRACSEGCGLDAESLEEADVQVTEGEVGVSFEGVV
jgi:hypothetical protein